MLLPCEQLGDTGLCVPLNAFNRGENRNSIRCHAVGCEDTCSVRAHMIEHNQERARIHLITDPYLQLEELTAANHKTGRALQALPNLEGIRSLGARFVH